MENQEKTKPPEMKFCRLCGKNKPIDDIGPIILFQMGTKAIVYQGCRSCEIVIHNATLIVKETIEREAKKIIQAKEPNRIIVPGIIIPKDLKGDN